MSQQYRELRPSDTGQSLQTKPSPGPRAKKRPQIYAACERCRGLKVRCDGLRPVCARCSRNNQVCRYDTAAGDETRTHALKRSVDSLQNENTELQELLQHLRSRPQLEADEILKRLRSNPAASVPDILRFIKEGDLLAEGFARSGTTYDVNLPRNRSPVQFELAGRHPNVYSQELPNWRASGHDFISAVLYETFGKGTELIWKSNIAQPEVSDSPSSALLDAQSSPLSRHRASTLLPAISNGMLCDERLGQATCRPWTKVIKSDKLFQSLLSLYFIWLHPSFCLFDQNLFLNDLVSNDADSKYCSPILVNAILSLSYLHYALLEPAKDQEPTLHSLVFVQQSLQHYKDSRSSGTLTNVQAIMLIGIIYQCLGKDTAARTYQDIAVNAAMKMSENLSSRTAPLDRELYFVQQTTIWGVFQLNNMSSFILRRPILFDKLPRCSLPSRRLSESGDDEYWSPLPYTGSTLRLRLGHETFVARCHLWAIGADINRQRYEAGSFVESRRLNIAEAFYVRLLKWADSISDTLRPDASAPPHVLLLFAWFHMITMELFRPFAERGAARLQTLASSHSQADMIFAESFRQLQMIFVLLTTQFDPCLIPMEILQALTIICSECRKDLFKKSDSTQLFIMSYTILGKLSHSFPVLMAVLRAIKDAVTRLTSETPPALDMIFAAISQQIQTRRTAMSFEAEMPPGLGRSESDGEMDSDEEEDVSMSDVNSGKESEDLKDVHKRETQAGRT